MFRISSACIFYSWHCRFFYTEILCLECIQFISTPFPAPPSSSHPSLPCNCPLNFFLSPRSLTYFFCLRWCDLSCENMCYWGFWLSFVLMNIHAFAWAFFRSWLIWETFKGLIFRIFIFEGQSSLHLFSFWIWAF